MAPNLTLQQQQAIARAKAKARAAAEQAPAAAVTPKSSYDEMAAVPQRSVVGQAPQWDRQATADDRMLARGQDPINEANNNLRRGWESGNVGEMVSGAQTYARNLVRKPPTPRQAAEAAGTLIVEASGAGQIGRVADYVGQKTGNEFLQTDAFKTGPDYNPTADMAALPLNALTWSTRAAGGGLINPRSATAAVKNAAKDVATNFTMGGSDLATAAYKGGRNALSSGPPQAPQPSPVAPAQPRPPGAGQMPNAGNAAPVLNAVPAAPVVPKGQIRVAKDTAKILTRIMRSSRIKDADVRGYLPGAVQRYKALNDERVPFAFFLESDLPNHFPQPIADEVTTKLRTWGRERNSATGPQDTSRRTIQETTQTLRSGQQDYLSGVMDNNLYKGKLIGKEDQFKGELEANGRVAYNTAIKNANDSLLSGRATVEQRDAVGRIQELLHNPAFLKNVPEHLRIKALRDGIDIEDYVQKDPIAAAHWLQSELRQAVSAAEGVGGVATSESRLYGEMRDGLLKELEKFNGYKGARKAHGDIYGAVEAINFGDSFFRAARSEVETARLAREFKALSKRQKTAATMSIRDALKNEFRNKAEDTAAKVTRLQQAGVLDALETVLGADGKRVSDAIRNVVKQNDQLKAIDQGSGSPTFNNMRGADAARDMVQSPVNKAIGAFGDKTSWPMTVAGDVVLASSGLPPVLTAGKAATALVDRFGNPSAKTMSRATEGLYGLPKAPQNALAPPPRTPRVGGPKAPKAPPTQQTLDDLLAQYDAIDHRAEPGKAASVLKKIETLKKQLESGTAGPALLGSSKKPPQKMGFGGGSKQLDMSEPARMQRAREQGFDTKHRLYHATHSDFDAFDTSKIRSDLQIGEDAIFLTDSPAVADSYLGGVYTAKGKGGVDVGGGVERHYSNNAAVYPVFVRHHGGKFETWDMNGGGYDPAFMQRAIKEAKANGAPGVILRGVRDPGIMDTIGPQGNPRIPSNLVIVFDPKDIRSVNAKFDPAETNSSKLLAGLPSGTSAAIGAIGGGAYGALGPLQDMDGDGDKDAADRQAMIAAYGMGGLSSGVAIGALKGAGRSVIGAMGRGGAKAPKGSYGSRPSAMGDLAGHQAAQRQLRELEDYRKTAPPSEHAAVDQEIADLRGFLQGETPKPANDTLPKGQQTPAQDLAMARAFNSEPLTAERAYDFWTLLKDEKDPRKIMDVLDMNLDPSILRVPRGKAMVERAREEVLRRATSFMRKETELNKSNTLSRANAKMAENNRSIANEIAQLRARGVPDQMIARSLGLEDGSVEYFLKYREPPAQNGFGGGKRTAPNPVADAEKILSDVRVASQLSPEQYKPLFDAVSARMKELQAKKVKDPFLGKSMRYDATQEGSDEIHRLNGLLMNYFRTPDGGMDFGKVFRWAEANDPDNVLRVKAGRHANDIEDITGTQIPKPKPAQNAFGFGGGKNPPPPPIMVKKGPRKVTLSPEESQVRRELKNAKARATRNWNDTVMKPNRDELREPYQQAVRELEEKLIQVQQRERKARIARVGRRQAFQRIAKHPTTSILAGGAALGFGSLALKTAFPERQKEPEDTSRPGYWFDRVATQDKETASKMQLALHQWGVWPTEMRTLRNGFKQKEPVEMTGRWGRASKDAFKRWLYEIDPTRDPEDPITPEDVERLLAGPKGYQDDDGHWQNPRDRKPIAAR